MSDEISQMLDDIVAITYALEMNDYDAIYSIARSAKDSRRWDIGAFYIAESIAQAALNQKHDMIRYRLMELICAMCGIHITWSYSEEGDQYHVAPFICNN